MKLITEQIKRRVSIITLSIACYFWLWLSCQEGRNIWNHDLTTIEIFVEQNESLELLQCMKSQNKKEELKDI